MPSVNDLVDVAESLEKCRVAVLADSCIAVRNRNASCRKCVDACPADAISVKGNKLELSAGRCTDCGLCTIACPTAALSMTNPTEAELQESLGESREANGGRAVIVCARMAARRLANPALYVEVPCLGCVSEATLLGQFADGASEVVLVDGGCSTCKYGFVDASVQNVVLTADVLLEAQGLPQRAQRAQEFPEGMLAGEDDEVFGSTRRGFFSDTVKTARQMTATAVDAALKKELGQADADNIGTRLHVSEDGTLPTIAVPRHENLLNALFALGDAVQREGEDALDVRVDTHLFGAIEIDSTKCNACGMCAVFCPTSAIKRDPLRESPTAPLKLLEFSASDCVQCGLCQDVCWKKCIDLSSEVSLDQLFSFEPKVFRLR